MKNIQGKDFNFRSGFVISKHIPEDISPFDRVFEIFKELLTHTSGDIEEAFEWLDTLDKEYSIFTDEYTLADFEEDLKKRAEIRKLYVSLLSEIPGIIIPFRDYTEFSSNYILPVVLRNGNAEKRDQIRAALAEAGIQTSMHYPAVHRFSIYKEFYSELPVTDYLVNNLITLPMYSKLTEEQVIYICNSLKGLL